MDDTSPKPPSGEFRRALSRLLALLLSNDMKKWRPRMALALFLTLIAKLFAVGAPVAFGEGVNAIAGRAADTAIWGFVVAFLLYAGARFMSVGAPQLRDAFFAPVSQDAQRLTAVRAFGHVQRLSIGFHQTKRTGALNKVIDRGSRAIDFFLRFFVFNIGPTVVELLLAASVMGVAYGWEFPAIAVVTVAAYTISTTMVTEWRVKLRRDMNEADNEASARAVDALMNFETVKSFAAEQRETDRYDEALTRYADAASRSSSSLALLNGLQALVMNLGLLAMALVAGWKAWNGVLQPGDIAAVTLILMNIYQPLNILGWAYREIRQAAVDMERLFETLSLSPDVADAPDADALEDKGGAVKFDHVSFAHEGRDRSLDEVSFDLPPGSFTGVCGPSGAGKSTLLKLLFRFYDPASGRILIDGQDIRRVTQQSLRDQLGLVPQDVVLFNDTLRANIQYGNPDADEAALMAAAERARLGDFIRSLPQGLDTLVGERGLKLSGGEKQRVGVARAIIKNPRLLILDEATSALDSGTEEEVQKALNEAAQGRTTLAVAHRLSTIAGADQILVMEQGRIVERGTHAELLAIGGLYARMWQRQAEAETILLEPAPHPAH
ncbi:ABC transporter ATP-binding protein/permease [Hyphobacterium sp. HN65]|uniref:ABC transporter ATP-binding protein/permease n=1 Tax=Hyphobacterium lacteum TaxID=3116575 RepID=A0ABU7LU74_9PROT|nr:ABC transporter ATP-binding protein/permease [Hyphobacterium sp. HN65]MEE2527109.1 ABC transporter ATP-binding protein/permease [Hyphobacterium sp. HN65]